MDNRSNRNKNQALTLPREVAFRVALWGVALTTLFFYTTIIDPFNAPKSWIIYLTASWVLGFLVFDLWGATLGRDEKITLALFGAFIFAMLIDLFATSYLYTAFFGDYGRRTGFLSYLSLAVIALTTMRLINLKNLPSADFMFLIVATLVSFYGLAQHSHLDFVKWNNPFNPVISTLGNPDFASATMGILAALTFGVFVNRSREVYLRIWAGVNTIALLAAIHFSQALQGFLISIMGIGFICLVWIFQKQKTLGWVSLGAGFIVGIFSIFGMLDKGPLKHYLYKVSVIYRGDYWRAGMRMFLHHPIFGVGLDRFGEYFRQYRDSTQSLRRGPDLVSNAAHNVFIQFAATGGVILLVTYLALVIYVGWRAWIAIKNSSGVEQIAVAGIVAGWIAYLAQSIISIDNLGVVIWGWFLSGAVLGISHSVSKGESTENRKKRFSGEASTLLSGLVTTVTLIIVIMLFIGDKAVLFASASPYPKNAAQQGEFQSIVEKPLHNVFIDPATALIVSGKLAQGGLVNEAKVQINKYLAQDHNNYQFISTLSELDEQSNDIQGALPYRKLTTEIDPYNAGNLLHYGLDLLRNSHDVAGAKAELAKINAFDANSPESKELASAIAQG